MKISVASETKSKLLMAPITNPPTPPQNTEAAQTRNYSNDCQPGFHMFHFSLFETNTPLSQMETARVAPTGCLVICVC